MHNLLPIRVGRAAIALLLVCTTAAACDRSRSAGTPDTTATAAEDTTSIQAGLSWRLEPSDSGVTLILVDASGAPLLHLACMHDPRRLTVVAETFTPIGSEERLSFGIDDEPVVFVADPGARRASGVQAEAPVDLLLLERLPAARAVSAVYGAQVLGPYMPPETEMSAHWVASCRNPGR